MVKTEKRTETNKSFAGAHSLMIEDRERMTLAGVTEVSGFSESAFSFKTLCGAFMIKGKNLTISRLNTETGELFVSGEITSVQYFKDSRKKGSLLEGLFK